jgi:hypothetical protein
MRSFLRAPLCLAIQKANEDGADFPEKLRFYQSLQKYWQVRLS